LNVNIHLFHLLFLLFFPLNTFASTSKKCQLSDYEININNSDLITPIKHQVIPCQTSYFIKLSEKPLNPNWFNAFTEVGFYTGIGIGLYSLRTESMEEDWDYQVEDGFLDHIWQRHTSLDSWKLDDNDMMLNWGHVYAGAFYHQAFRNNDLSLYSSMVGPLVGSLFWEIIAEYKEVISINDHVTTIFGGVIMGEGMFQTSQMLKQKQGLFPKILSSFFNPSQTFHDWYDDKIWGTSYRNINKEFGFNTNVADDLLTVYSGITYSQGTLYSEPRDIFTLGFKTRTSNLPIKLKKSQFYSFDPLLTQTQFEIGITQEGNDGLFTDVKVIYSGFVDYNLQENESNSLTGHRLIIGPSAAVEFNSIGKYENEDLYGVINLLGGAFDYVYFKDKFQFNMQFESYADFALIKPFATNAFNEGGHIYWRSKPVLWKEKYSYALGFTTKINLNMQYNKLSFGFSSKRHIWDSIDNTEFERVNDAPNTNDINFKDNRTIYQTYIAYDLSNLTRIKLNYKHIKREGELIGIDNKDIYFHSQDNESLWSLSFEYQY